MANYFVLASALLLTVGAVLYFVGFGAPPPTIAELLHTVNEQKK